jgi:hypothetical protein
MIKRLLPKKHMPLVNILTRGIFLQKTGPYHREAIPQPRGLIDPKYQPTPQDEAALQPKVF